MHACVRVCVRAYKCVCMRTCVCHCSVQRTSGPLFGLDIHVGGGGLAKHLPTFNSFCFDPVVIFVVVFIITRVYMAYSRWTLVHVGPVTRGA